MAKRKNWLGILVITLVFGMMVFGCNDDSTDGGGGVSTDPALNGTWVLLDICQYSISGNTLTLTIYYTDGSTDVTTFTKTSGGGGTDPLNGTWKYTNYISEYGEDRSTYVFDNGSFEYIEYQNSVYPPSEYTYKWTGTYTKSGDKLMLFFQTEIYSYTEQYSINDNTLTIGEETWTKITSSGGGTEDPLNGTWTQTSTENDHGEMVTTTTTYKFNNGSLETESIRYYIGIGDGHTRTETHTETGIYTTSGSNITITKTYSSYLDNTLTFNNGILVVSVWGSTQTQTLTYTTSGNNITIDGEVYQYSISGNTLTFLGGTFIKI